MSSPIKILNAELTELATIAVASSAIRAEKINSDNTLNFSIRVKSGYGDYISDTSVFDLDGDYFDVAYYKKEQQGDGKLMISVESEHVSYRLNNAEYDIEYFTMTDTPANILAAILDGTDFSVDTVDFTDPVTFSLQEAASRRGLLMQFTAYMGGELEFDAFNISLLTQRGSATPTALTVGKDITVLSKAVDKRNLDDEGNPTISYTCGVYKGASINLGDVVTIDYDALDIDVSLRVVSKAYDPYNPNNVTVEIGNYTSGLEDDLYRIETQKVGKDALMNGCRIGPQYGFEAVRNDKKARAFFKSDGLAIQTGDGSGSSWTNKMWVEIDGEGNAHLMFNGTLSADVINALSVLITPNLYAEKATISELTVDQLDTSTKVQNYLSEDTSDVNYIKALEQTIQFITATTDGSATEQATDRNGNPLYWTDATHTAATTDETAWPVMIYVYTEAVKASFSFDLVDEAYVPRITMGAGTGTGENGKAFLYKALDGLYIDYYNSPEGDLRRFKIGNKAIEATGMDYCQTAKNTGAVAVDTSETSAASKDITLDVRSRLVIMFSAEVNITGGAAEITAKTYINSVAQAYQPTLYCAATKPYILTYIDAKEGLAADDYTVEVKLLSDANGADISVGHAVLVVQAYASPLPNFDDATDFTLGEPTESSIAMTWNNPSGSHFTGVELYRHTADLASATRAWCDANATLIYSGTDEEFEDTGLSAETHYYYKLFAVYAVDGDVFYSIGVADDTTTSEATATPYQAWDNCPDSPVLTSEYPYQCTMYYGGYTTLACSTGPAYLSGSSIMMGYGGATTKTYRYWVSEGPIWYPYGTYTSLIAAIVSTYLTEANADIYTDNTFTTVAINKTT